VSGKSTFTQEMADKICERIIGGETVGQITADDNMPAKSTVFKWLAENSGFSDQYARAKMAQMDMMAEELLEIADDGTNDWMERKNDDGEAYGWRENGEAMARSRLRVDTRKWLMSKMAPKKYGERTTTDINHSGDIGLMMQRIDGKTKSIS